VVALPLITSEIALGHRASTVLNSPERESMEELGKIAYDAYKDKASGVSLISGAVLPEWDGLNGGIQEAWTAAANAVLVYYAEQRKAENKPS
jgi:hypothetical protein